MCEGECERLHDEKIGVTITDSCFDSGPTQTSACPDAIAAEGAAGRLAHTRGLRPEPSSEPCPQVLACQELSACIASMWVSASSSRRGCR
jgi:hypothetical protein